MNPLCEAEEFQHFPIRAGKNSKAAAALGVGTNTLRTETNIQIGPIRIASDPIIISGGAATAVPNRIHIVAEYGEFIPYTESIIRSGALQNGPYHNGGAREAMRNGKRPAIGD